MKHPDLYQLFAYAQAADLQTGLLVYAAGESEPGQYRIVHSDTVLEVRTVQLMQAPSELLAEVAELAVWIRNTPLVSLDRHWLLLHNTSNGHYSAPTEPPGAVRR